MKKIINFLWPVLLLFLALGFMTQFKHLNVSTDMKRYEIQSYVEASQNGEDLEDTMKVQREDGDQEQSADENEQDKMDEEDADEHYAGPENEETDEEEEDEEEDEDESSSETDYAITSDETTVTVHDADGNTVFETSLEDWEEHREEYYKEYKL